MHLQKLTVGLLGIVLLAAIHTPVRAQSPSVPDSTAITYWGQSPERSPETTITPTLRSRKPWEYVVMVPYEIISIPFRLVAAGVQFGLGRYEKGTSILGAILGPFAIGEYSLGWTVAAGGLSGFGVGLNFRHRPPDPEMSRVHLQASTTVRGSDRVALGLRFPVFTHDMIMLGALYRKNTNARFFGIGPEAPAENESFYTLETSVFGAIYTHKFSPDFAAEAGLLLSTAGTRPPDDDHEPSLEEVFGDDLPVGYQDRSDGMAYQLELRHANIREPGRPQHGGVRRISARYFNSFDKDDVRYWDFAAELQQFVPLWHTRRALAARAYITWIEDQGDTEIPFQRLNTLQDPVELRGYQAFRFYDEGFFALNLEYRWPIWAFSEIDGPGMDAYLFSDVGQVFDDFNQITRRNLTFSYGGGVRLVGAQGFSTRIEIAASNEEVVFRLRGNQIFQFGRAGLFSEQDR